MPLSLLLILLATHSIHEILLLRKPSKLIHHQLLCHALAEIMGTMASRLINDSVLVQSEITYVLLAGRSVRFLLLILLIHVWLMRGCKM